MISYRITRIEDLDKLPESEEVATVRKVFHLIQAITFEEEGEIIAIAPWSDMGEDTCAVSVVVVGEKMRGAKYVRAARNALREVFLKGLRFNTLYTESDDTKYLHRWHSVLSFKDKGIVSEGKRAWELK